MVLCMTRQRRTYISDDFEFFDVGDLCMQQLPYGLLLVELKSAQGLQVSTQSPAWSSSKI